MKRIAISIILLMGLLLSVAGQQPKQCANQTCCADNLDSLQLVMLIPFKIKAEHIEGFTKAINKCAAETVKEEGCLDYTIYQSPNDPSLFMLTEGWVNKRYHIAHMKTPHLKVYFEEIKGMSDSDNPRKAEVYRVCPKCNQKK